MFLFMLYDKIFIIKMTEQIDCVNKPLSNCLCDIQSRDMITKILNLTIHAVNIGDEAKKLILYDATQPLLYKENETGYIYDMSCSRWPNCPTCKIFTIDSIRDTLCALLLAFKQHVNETRTADLNIPNYESQLNTLYTKCTLLETKCNQLQTENNELYDICTDLQNQINILKMG